MLDVWDSIANDLGDKTLIDYKTNKNEMIASCNHTINKIEEYQRYIRVYVTYFRGAVEDGIVPPEVLAVIVDHLEGYIAVSNKIVGSIWDYIVYLKTNGDDYQTWDDTISRGRDLLSTLEGRVLFAGNMREYECIENVIRDGFYKTSYWLSQRFLMSKRASEDLDLLPFRRVYENVCKSCHELIYGLDRFIYELKQTKELAADWISTVVE